MDFTAPGIAVDGLTVSFGTKPVLMGISFSLPSAGLVAVIGPNGAGKTTLLKAICGLVAFQGSIEVLGEDLAAMPRQKRSRTIAYLPQGHQIHWPLSGRDVVALGRFPHGVSDPARMGAVDAAAVTAAMARTDALQFAERPVQGLSGGERARVMMARVLAVGASLLLADEPTAALDPRHQLTMMQDLQAEAARGALVLAVTHDLTLAARFADRVVLLDEGRLVAEGTPRAVLTPERMEAVYGIDAHLAEKDGAMVILPWQVTAQ